MGNLLDAEQRKDITGGTRVVAVLYASASLGVPAIATWAPSAAGHFQCSLWSVGQGRVWTMLFSLFYRPIGANPVDTLMAVSELSMAASYLPGLERELGSLRFLLWTVLANVGSNAFFLGFMHLLRLALGPKQEMRYRFQPNAGLWPLIMVCVTLRSLRSPEAPADVLGVVTVRNRWYPFGLATGLSVLGATVQWDSFAAIAYGHAYSSLGIERFLPLRTAHLLERHLERRTDLRRRGLLGGSWVPPPGFAGDGPSGPGTRAVSGRDFHLFGGQGHRLGN